MAIPNLSDLTIIIPTVSRPMFVLRQFEYWGETNANVVILDGASSPIEIPAHLRRPNIVYQHTGTRFNERLAHAGELITTRYCALLPDDEFFLPSGLRAAMNRLDTKSELIGCVGRNLYFFVDQGRFLVRDAYRDWAPFPERPLSLYERLDADLPPNRTHKAQFAILRSGAWRTMFESSYSTFFSCGYTYERLLNLQRTVLGETEILEDLIWMRSMENPPLSTVNVPRTGGHDFVSWARNPEFSNEVKQYRTIIKGILRSGGLDDEEVDYFEDRFFAGGVHRQATKEARNKRKLSWILGKVAFRRTPKSLRRVAKRYLSNRYLRLVGWEGYRLDVMCESLVRRGTNFVREELDRVADLSLALDRKVRER